MGERTKAPELMAEEASTSKAPELMAERASTSKAPELMDERTNGILTPNLVSYGILRYLSILSILTLKSEIPWQVRRCHLAIPNHCILTYIDKALLT